MEGVTTRAARRIQGEGIEGVEALDERVAVEEPLEVRLAGEPLMVTMRTPGDDRFLAVGFLFAEGVIDGLDDVGAVHHCGRPDEEGYGNVIEVAPGPGVTLDPQRLEGSRRGTLTTASCGVCGRKSIDDLLERIGPIDREVRLRRGAIAESQTRLAEGQRRFRETGGVHAAAALDAEGNVLAHAEDVGRHNAVDKVVGRLLYDATIDAAVILAVSGRVSFEIIQKAAAAKIAVVSAVSAPTSLAIDLAERAGITLAAFVRGGRTNVYTYPRRVR